jgi:hypothetical protein
MEVEEERVWERFARPGKQRVGWRVGEGGGGSEQPACPDQLTTRAPFRGASYSLPADSRASRAVAAWASSAE